MDVIDRAIEKKWHVSKKQKYNVQEWKDFHDSIKSRKILLAGLGNGVGYLCDKYGDKISFDAVFDNDQTKQGIPANIFIDSDEKYINELPPVEAIASIKRYINDNPVVLITSLKSYDEIADEIESIGISDIYILLIMEANQRQKGEKPNISRKKNYEDYAKLPIDNNKVFFQGYGPYSDHVRFIAEKIRELNKEIKIVFAVSDYVDEMPNDFYQILMYRTPKRYAREIETAKIVLYNHDLPEDIIKRKNQIHIHTKHWASITLKKFYLDSKYTTDSDDDIRRWKKNFNELDYVFTGSDFDDTSVRRGFAINTGLIHVGSPRSDIMFQFEKYKKLIREKYALESYDGLVLYAPTYRFGKENGINRHVAVISTFPDFNKIKNVFEKKYGGEWAILLRAHPAVSKFVSEISLPSYVIDVSKHQDGEELCAACDVMISDYSSIMFEPAFVGKPVFLYAPDKEEYIDNEYDLLIDYDSLPFPISTSNDELVDLIGNFDEKNYVRKVNAFFAKYGVKEDGHASERAAQFIIDLLKQK